MGGLRNLVVHDLAQALLVVAQPCATPPPSGDGLAHRPEKMARFVDGMSLAKSSVTMTKNLASALALVLAGFAVGAMSSSVARPSQSEPKVVVEKGHHESAARVNDAAASCGVYGLPGSPAVVALLAGADGRPVKATIESDIFGGADAESCVLSGVAGMPMRNDVQRVVLSVYQPDDSVVMLATR